MKSSQAIHAVSAYLTEQESTIHTPAIIPRREHNISRALISENALRVLYRLSKAGYEAYLVGGGVRDLLLGREPKDYDVATDASPEEVRRLFRNSRLIGRRFRLAHVRYGSETIEVATFRAGNESDQSGEYLEENGRIVRDNVYGTMDQDAWRRDFTVNALYYNIQGFSVIDYTSGMVDLEAGLLRLIGEPEQRYREDPVRMLRAVRLAAKLGFRIESQTETPLFELGSLLQEVPSARLFDELLKLFHGGVAVQSFELLRHYGMFEHLFPDTETALCEQEQGFPLTLLVRALANTDTRIAEEKPVTPAFLFAALLWEPVRRLTHIYASQGIHEMRALQLAADEVIARQVRRVAVPKRFSLPMREIWSLQFRFCQLRGKRPLRLLRHPRFRAAYDFLSLRCAAGEAEDWLCTWWTEFQGADDEARALMLEAVGKGKKPSRRRKQERAR